MDSSLHEGSKSNFREQLATRLQKARKTQPWTEKRFENIRWIENLDREKLEFETREVRLRLKTTQAGEQVFIQYPGKESKASTRRTTVRPWDFRPKLRLANGDFAKDLSFYDIWDAIYQNMSAKNCPENLGAILGIVFYRMAFMVDHAEQKISASRIEIESGKEGKSVGLECPPVWFYTPPSDALKIIGDKQLWAKMSFEGFLLYNELLAWNEDCKYYYRAVEEKNEKWKADGTGRVNTLLTHLSVVGFHEGKIPLATLLAGFSQNRGVSAANEEQAKAICAPHLS